MTDWSELRSGAMPGHDAEEQEWERMRHDGGDLPIGYAERLADSILSEPPMGRDEPSPFYRGEKELRRSEARRGRGLPQGFGDEAARAGYDASTGQ